MLLNDPSLMSVPKKAPYNLHIYIATESPAPVSRLLRSFNYCLFNWSKESWGKAVERLQSQVLQSTNKLKWAVFGQGEFYIDPIFSLMVWTMMKKSTKMTTLEI